MAAGGEAAGAATAEPGRNGLRRKKYELNMT